MESLNNSIKMCVIVVGFILFIKNVIQISLMLYLLIDKNNIQSNNVLHNIILHNLLLY